MSVPETPTSVQNNLFLTGGGEMGERMRLMNWDNTSLGPVENWPQSLKTTVSVCLNSKFPILLWWGKEMIMIYNDAYRPILGESKHPKALGAEGQEVWKEIWHVIGPMLESVLNKGESTWSQNQLLLLNRYGYAEECYFTFSYSPIYDESGSIGGIFCAVTETTEEVISARHLKSMRDLSTTLADVKTEQAVFEKTLEVLCNNNKDFPFVALYSLEDDVLKLTGKSGDDIPIQLIPKTIHANKPFFNLHCLVDLGKDSALLENIGLKLPAGGWQESSKHVLVLPITQAGNSKPLAILITGVNPHHALDEKYKGFFKLFCDQVASKVVNVRSFNEAKKRAESLQEIDKAKTVFFSNVSHEFRTPLTLMLGPLEALLNDSTLHLPDEHKDGMSATHRNAMRLLRLVNMLLDFSRIEAGRLEALYQPVDLKLITNDIASNFRSLIEDAGLQFDVQTEGVTSTTYVDVGMWEKIVLNLISNAFKYTVAGKISVSLEPNPQHILLKVTDTGVGIPAHELPRMFERFHRINNPNGRTIEGTGIGLSLVKELVNLHGGSIAVESEEGKGSTFTVSVPYGKKHLPEAQVSESTTVGLSNLSGIYINEIKTFAEGDVQTGNEQTDSLPIRSESGDVKVLVVDDNADMKDYIERILKRYYKVTTASNGKEALNIVQSFSPDLVISDIMMPEMNGLELLNTLRSNPRTNKIPVLFLSARAGEESKIEGLETGADDYLVKPFAAKELLARVNSQVRLLQLRKNVELQISNAFTSAPVATSILMGPEFWVTQVNKLMLEIWGKTCEEVMDKPLFEGLHEAKGQGFEELLTQVLQTGVPFISNEHTAYLNRDGKKVQKKINFVYEPLRDVDGMITGIVAVATDVTELVEARNAAQMNSQLLEQEVLRRTEDLKRTNAELLNTNSELEQFAYISSHDLQEPLRKIQTFTELVNRNLANEKFAQRYLEKIDGSAHRMSNLIKSILTYSKMSKADTKKERIDLNKVLEDVKEDFELLIEEKHASIACGRLPTINGDPLQLHQLFSNLVSNSIKFSESVPDISIKGDSLSKKEVNDLNLDLNLDYVKLAFEDNGIGFEDKYNTRVFDMFQRLNNRGNYEGTGIGLALCKKIVENHGGRISVASKPGKGSTFTILLPINSNG